MQGTSESWQRLNRMRAVGGGADGPSVSAQPAPVRADLDGAGTGPGGDVAAGTGAPPPTTAARRWVPDDDIPSPDGDGSSADAGVDGCDRDAPPGADGADPLGFEPGGGVDDRDDTDDDRDLDGVATGGPSTRASRRRPRARWRARLRRSLGRSAELWVPESVRGARTDPGRRGVMALLLVAALAASITAVGVWRERPQERPSGTVSVSGALDPGLTPAAGERPGSGDTAGTVAAEDGSVTARIGTLAASDVDDSEIVVSVTGLVIRPGVVTLAAGMRVADAIAAAGGLSPDADVTGVNLAARLRDGDSVIISATGTSVSGESGAAGSGTGGRSAADRGTATENGQTRVDLNTADATELDTLPGVGPVMAGNIVAWRDQNGPFTAVEQLQEISGIGPARYAQLAELVAVS